MEVKTRKQVREERLPTLYAEGLTDRQMAERLGCTATVPRQWRKRHGLPPHTPPVMRGSRNGQGRGIWD